jgi:hypothetical protein
MNYYLLNELLLESQDPSYQQLYGAFCRLSFSPHRSREAPFFSPLHRLRVYDRGRGLHVAVHLFTDFLMEMIVDLKDLLSMRCEMGA